MNMSTRLESGFFSNSEGGVAVMAALTSLVVIGLTGAALDSHRADASKAHLQRALDASALAGAQALASGGAEAATDAATRYFNSNMQAAGQARSFRNFKATPDATAGLVQTSAELDLDTTFAKIFKVSKMTGTLTARAAYGAAAAAPPMDVGLMLDVSGSMAGSRFTGLKLSVRAMLDELIGGVGKTSPSVRLGFAPFSSSVNAGGYAASLIGHASATNCVAERTGIYQYTDAAPNGDFFDVTGTKMISDDATGSYETRAFKGYGSPYFDVSTVCPKAEIFPLTGVYDLLSAQLEAYTPAAITAGHTGMAFAWYLISDKWASFWPSGRKPAAGAKKVVVLMSDGEFNAYFTSNGLPNVQGKALCDNMKAAGVTVFAVAFDMDGDSADLLKACASKPEYFYGSKTVEDMIAAFKAIAGQLKTTTTAGKLRLVK